MIPGGEDPSETNSPPNVRALLSQYGIRPRKSLGQNFLVHQKSLKKIVSFAALHGSETILEIGAGLGSLTYYLAPAAKKVIAVEIDRGLIPVLESSLISFKNVLIVQGDILKTDLQELVGGGPYQVVANIPYQITSYLIRRFLERDHPPESMVLTIQREVAERIIAGPGRMNLLALSVQVYGQPEILGNIPSRYFYPEPNVDSAIIRIRMHSEAKIKPGLVPLFFKIARAGFQQKRKKLRNSLSAGLGLDPTKVENALEKTGIDPGTRPQALDLDSWIRLAKQVNVLISATDVEKI